MRLRSSGRSGGTDGDHSSPRTPTGQRTQNRVTTACRDAWARSLRSAPCLLATPSRRATRGTAATPRGPPGSSPDVRVPWPASPLVVNRSSSYTKDRDMSRNDRELQAAVMTLSLDGRCKRTTHGLCGLAVAVSGRLAPSPTSLSREAMNMREAVPTRGGMAHGVTTAGKARFVTTKEVFLRVGGVVGRRA
jgi:hypothetical protein